MSVGVSHSVGVFAGIPAGVLLLIALPLYGGRWYRRVTRSRAADAARRRGRAAPGLALVRQRYWRPGGLNRASTPSLRCWTDAPSGKCRGVAVPVPSPRVPAVVVGRGYRWCCSSA